MTASHIGPRGCVCSKRYALATHGACHLGVWRWRRGPCAVAHLFLTHVSGDGQAIETLDGTLTPQHGLGTRDLGRPLVGTWRRSSTRAANLVVMGPGCDGCASVDYDPAASTSASNAEAPFELLYGSAALSATPITDVVGWRARLGSDKLRRRHPGGPPTGEHPGGWPMPPSRDQLRPRSPPGSTPWSLAECSMTSSRSRLCVRFGSHLTLGGQTRARI